jgi:MoaA/NifB/PqqE/SkfB family radical SAM enzyme
MVISRNDSCRFNMFTNGARFDEYWTDVMLDRGGFVNFSVNALSRDVYDRLHRLGRFDDVHRNLSALLDARRHARTSSLSVESSMVVVRENVAELPAFTAWAADAGIDGIRYFVDPQLLPPATAETFQAIDAALEVAESRRRSGFWVWGLGNLRGHLAGTPVPPHELESFGCRRTFGNLYVAVNGKASFCNFLEKHPIGDLTIQELSDIWNGDAALAQRRAQDQGDWTYCTSQYCGPATSDAVAGTRKPKIPLTLLDRRR